MEIVAARVCLRIRRAHPVDELDALLERRRGLTQKTCFIETNIRAVFIHHFFSERESVTDREILPLVERTLDREEPRDWYYALMDYGATLKKTATASTAPKASTSAKPASPLRGQQ